MSLASPDNNSGSFVPTHVLHCWLEAEWSRRRVTGLPSSFHHRNKMTLPTMLCGSLLRSAVGERGKWSVGWREAPSESQPERNDTPPSRRRKPAAPAAISPCKLVTSARFAKWSGRRREGDGAMGRPWSAANRALVTAALQFPVAFPSRSAVKCVPAPTVCRLRRVS